MSNPSERTVADHLAALQALLPSGTVWPRELGSALGQILRGVAVTATRLRTRAEALLVDAFPATALELLPEWEAAVGLPDPCAGPAPSLQQRRSQVVARLTARGGQSATYVIDYAAQLGFQIRIEQFKPAYAGGLCAGDPLHSEAWAHTWRVHAPDHTVVPFRAGISAAGEPLAAWGNASLQCALGRIRPAHTIIQFAYGS